MLVDGNASLAPVDKLQYLLSCLSGDATRVVANLPIQGDNYARAYEKLRSRYENKRSIINAHLDTLFSLKPVNKKCARSLEQVRSTVAITIEALTALGGGTKDWDYFLVYLITKTLDSETQEAWELNISASTEPPTYSSLDAFLASRVRALESLRPASVHPAKPQPERQHNQVSSRGVRVNAATKTAPKPAPPAPSVQCFLCTAQHLLFQCPEYESKTPQQRYQILRDNGRCINCLSMKHYVSNCTSVKRCSRCKEAHHTTIHDHVSGLNPAAAPHTPSGSQKPLGGASAQLPGQHSD